LNIIREHYHQLLPKKTVEQTSYRFLTKFIDLLSTLTYLLSNNYQVINDGTSPNDRDYDELVMSHNNDGFPLDQSSCEPIDMEAFSKAQLVQQLDDSYTR